ncbi:MAG: TolC family protein [Crocinitomicaceae bacterium]|jgi:outer membrane protein TolC|nr:TolC family protein [Crocinitomicaceae bacterium]
MLKNWLLGSSFLVAIIGIGQEKSTFSLSEAKEYALEHHVSVRNSALDTEIAIQKKNETRGIGLPQVNLNGTFNNFINLPVQVVSATFINPNAAPGETISFRAGTDYNSTGTMQVNQILFNGSYLVGLQVSKQYVDFSSTLEKQSQEEVAFSVIQAYNLAAVAKDNLQFVDSLVVITQELVDKQKNYLELGLMKQEDMDQLNYSLLTAKNAQTSAKNQYKNAMVMLKLTMNYPLESPLEISQSSDELMRSNNVAKGNLEDNMGLQILQKQMMLNTYSLKNEKFSRLPTLNGFFQQSYNAYRNEFDFFTNNEWFQQTFWGLQLNIPIYSGGQGYARIKQAELEVKKNENSIEQLQHALKVQEIAARNNLSSALDQFEMQSANVELAGKIYNNALIKEKIGSESSIVVTQKYNQLLMAQTQLTAAKIEVFNAKLELEKLYNQILK